VKQLLRIVTALVALATTVGAGSASAQEVSERQDGERRKLLQHQKSVATTGMATVEAPRVSVIVATRDRPEMLGRCVASILANDHDDFELIVVDQSNTQTVLPAHRRVRHVHTGTIGKSAALNVGVRGARGELLAFTDDDCTAPPGWLSNAVSLFLEHPELEMAFGKLVPIEHDPAKVLVPGTLFRNSTLRIVQGRRSAYVRGGAGANLFARRRLFDVIGAWDEQIGPGSRFRACEEWDMYYRTLASGAAVALVPELEVLHWGVRTRSDGQELAWGYAYGEGAVIGKHLRLADFGMTAPALRILLGDILDVPRNIWHGERPGLRSLVWKCRGIVAGARQRVDRDRRVFVA
jgi:glycosyltransferase involved in cell wall biosynthesis